MNWHDMPKVEGGRSCAQCQKTVLDFQGKTAKEIDLLLEASNNKICGAYSDKQLVELEKRKWVLL